MGSRVLASSCTGAWLLGRREEARSDECGRTGRSDGESSSWAGGEDGRARMGGLDLSKVIFGFERMIFGFAGDGMEIGGDVGLVDD